MAARGLMLVRIEKCISDGCPTRVLFTFREDMDQFEWLQRGDTGLRPCAPPPVEHKSRFIAKLFHLTRAGRSAAWPQSIRANSGQKRNQNCSSGSLAIVTFMLYIDLVNMILKQGCFCSLTNPRFDPELNSNGQAYFSVRKSPLPSTAAFP